MPTPPRNPSGPDEADLAARLIEDAFADYRQRFKAITYRARSRFDRRDWHGAQADSVERLELYPRCIDRTLSEIEDLLGDRARSAAVWRGIRSRFSALVAARDDLELAESFFNSVALKSLGSMAIDHSVVYVASDFQPTPLQHAASILTTWPNHGSTRELVAAVLRSCPFETPFEDPERDARAAASAIEARLRAVNGGAALEAIDTVNPLFYRGKSAFIVGRLRSRGRTFPLVFPLLNTDRGIVVDAVLLEEDAASILFSFTRSYFEVEVEAPDQLIRFLKSIMPLKPIAELYISIGHNRHGKTELYRDLIRHLEASNDQFEIARGDRGMVMIVFTLPSYDVVFKVIRDEFPYPKTTVRRQVMEKYNLVFKHDRAGRLVDAQEFENWRFDRARFSNEVLGELQERAASSVRIEKDSVLIAHLYTERRVTPLNLYLRESDRAAACEAVLDYGQTVKDLAATNFFPGDLLLKNFGVTRHGRVVFYDYDELCLLTDINVRTLPPPRSPSEELRAEPWFYVGEDDIFPEEFLGFLGLRGELRDVFLGAHSDLLGLDYWLGMQERLRRGEIVDIFAYKQSRRFANVRT